jgi:hypothetical protein
MRHKWKCDLESHIPNIDHVILLQPCRLNRVHVVCHGGRHDLGLLDEYGVLSFLFLVIYLLPWLLNGH